LTSSCRTHVSCTVKLFGHSQHTRHAPDDLVEAPLSGRERAGLMVGQYVILWEDSTPEYDAEVLDACQGESPVEVVPGFDAVLVKLVTRVCALVVLVLLFETCRSGPVQWPVVNKRTDRRVRSDGLSPKASAGCDPAAGRPVSSRYRTTSSPIIRCPARPGVWCRNSASFCAALALTKAACSPRVRWRARSLRSSRS
jgi:hypothetical protein